MRLSLDTHIAVWVALDPNALTQAERRRMAGADTQLVPSAVAMRLLTRDAKLVGHPLAVGEQN